MSVPVCPARRQRSHFLNPLQAARFTSILSLVRIVHPTRDRDQWDSRLKKPWKFMGRFPVPLSCKLLSLLSCRAPLGSAKFFNNLAGSFLEQSRACLFFVYYHDTTSRAQAV